MRRLLLVSACSLAAGAATFLLAPAEAAAKPPIQDGFDGGGYVYGALPFIAGWDVDDRYFNDDDGEATVNLGVGGGYMGKNVKGFKWSAGGVFEYTYLDVDARYFDGHQVRLLGEARLGGGNDWIFGYGLIGLGLGINNWEYDPPNNNNAYYDETDPGFQLQIGGGCQVIVWKNLMVGGELDLDFGFYDCDGCFDDSYGTWVVSPEILVGWYF